MLEKLGFTTVMVKDVKGWRLSPICIQITVMQENKMGYTCKIKEEIIRLKQRNKVYSDRIRTLNQWIEEGYKVVITTQYWGLKNLENEVNEMYTLKSRQCVNGEEIRRLRRLLKK